MTKNFSIAVVVLIIGIGIGIFYSRYQHYLSKTEVHTITYLADEEGCNKAISDYRKKIMKAYDSADEAEYERLNNEAEQITNHCLNLMSN